MTECNKTTTISELPQCDSVQSDSYLIVQTQDTACKVKVSDLVLGPDNVSFYPDLTDILNRLDELTNIVQSNSAGWSQTKTTVDTNKSIWDQTATYDLAGLANDVNANKDLWTQASTLVATNSSSWENAASRVATDGGTWDQTADIVEVSAPEWNQARNITLDGVTAIYEALEIIETSPWFAYYNDDPTAPPMAAMWEMYNVVATNSASW